MPQTIVAAKQHSRAQSSSALAGDGMKKTHQEHPIAGMGDTKCCSGPGPRRCGCPASGL